MSKIVYKPHRVFGWRVYRASCSNGDSFVATVDKSGSRTEAANITLYTKGFLKGKSLSDDLAVIDRSPGTYSQNLNPLREGKFEFTATGDAQWWCINYATNKNSLPNVQPVTITAEKNITFPIGTKIFLCEGSAIINGSPTDAPISLKSSSNPIIVEAQTDVYGFLFLD